MATIGTTSTYKVGVPSFDDTADIQNAFRLYHYGSVTEPSTNADIVTNVSGNIGVAGHLKNLETLKAPIASPTFTGTVTIGGAISLPSNSIATAAIQNNAITAEKIATGAIASAAKIADGIVTNAKLENSSITVNGTNVALGGTVTVSPVAYSTATSGTSTVYGNPANKIYLGQIPPATPTVGDVWMW